MLNLYIYRNQISEVILTGCTELKHFFASHNKIRSIQGLTSCTKLLDLDISHNFLGENFVDLSIFPYLRNSNISNQQEDRDMKDIGGGGEKGANVAAGSSRIGNGVAMGSVSDRFR